MEENRSCKKLALNCTKLKHACDTKLGVAIGISKPARGCKKSLRGDANKVVGNFCTETCLTCCKFISKNLARHCLKCIIMFPLSPV